MTDAFDAATHLAADNRGAGVQCEDVADKGFAGALDLDHVCNLNDGILLWLGEDALATSTLNIKR